MRIARAALLRAWGLCGLFAASSFADQVVPSGRVVSRVNVRAAATTNGAIIGSLHPSERAEFLNEATHWYEVRLSTGERGFVSRAWTVRIASVASPVSLRFKVHFIDVGVGDAAVIDVGDKEIVIDGGNYVNDLTDYLSANQIIDGPIELLVVTHADSDHWKGLPRLLGLEGRNANPVAIEEFWEPGYERTCNPLASYEDFIDGVESLPGVRFLRPLEAYHQPSSVTSRVEPFQLPSIPGVTFTVLHTDDDPPASNGDCSYRINNASIVLMIEVSGFRFLFTGDANGKERNESSPGTPRHIEERLLEIERANPGTLRADVLKVPHHGSETASTQAFIDAVNPRVAIFSASTIHRLPRETTVQRYTTNTRVLLRTDETHARNADHILCFTTAQGALDCNYASLIDE